MNNLFKITKDNVDNFFTEYNKNKQNKINKTITKIKNKSNNNKQNLISQMKQSQQIKSTKPNFNCEIIKNNNDEIKPLNDKNYISKQINSIKSNVDNNSIDKNKNKIIFEYGKSKIKLDILKKLMKKNLNILNNIDNIIKNFLNSNPKLKLNTIINDNKNGSDKKIYWNNSGQIIIESEKNFNVILNRNKKTTENEKITEKKNEKIKITNNEKKYNLIDFGYIKIYDINFTEEFIYKHKIPSFNSIFTFSDNIKHFLKLIKLLDYTNKYKIKINQFSNQNLSDIIYQNLPIIISNIDEKKNLFDSIDKKFTFYIKITMEKTIAFIINKKEKLLYFFNSVEKKLSGYIFFYILNIDIEYKIINLNKSNKINSNIINSNIINEIKPKIINEINSSISDFSDSE